MPKQLRAKLETVKKLYEQQKYMYDNHTHSVPDRIVSIVSNHHAINRIAFSLSEGLGFNETVDKQRIELHE